MSGTSSNVVPDFGDLAVVVAGDLVADRYLFGQPARLSREAPVLVLRHEKEELGAGGAANAALNLTALGARTEIVGTVARDANGRELLALLEAAGVDVSGVVTATDWLTPTKTRILGAEPGRTRHQLLRVDREPDAPPSAAVRAQVAERVRARAGEVDALLVSDYGYGLCAAELGRAAAQARSAGTRAVLDPRRSFEPFSGVSAMTPNLGELAFAVARPVEELGSPAELARAALLVLERFAPELLLVTLGNRGMALFSRDDPEGTFVRAAGAESVVDVSGAGDTAAAAFTLALAAGLDGRSAMRLANAAAGIVVMEPGAAVCPIDRLRSTLPAAPHPLARALVR